ncbi:Ig-like domain-containing protein [Brevibacillus laterosporus]|uniref:Ig-like domain-containing protein n=1 Tax=Brevibacillus laterosporus TaxID=1465 RepID=UPI000B10E6AA|nr:Ig-like domain-containing protein [Brevibacillus laterosporus]
MATIKKLEKQFDELSYSSQTHTLTIPSLKSIKSVTVNTGTVSYKVNGNTVTFTFGGGSYTRSVQTGGSYVPTQTRVVTSSQTSGTNSFPSSMSYSVSGFSGNLSKSGSPSKTLVSGSTASSKTVSKSKSASSGMMNSCPEAERSAERSLPSSISYNEGGFSGTLYRTGSVSFGACRRSGRNPDEYWSTTATATYSGTVTRPSTAVYSYTQRYSGTITKPGYDTRSYTNYYRYMVTIEYLDNSNPTLNLSSPIDNQKLSENATLRIQGNASDIDKDNVVTVKYQVNKGTVRALQSGVSNGSTPISFAKILTFRAKRLYDGATDITGSDLAENTDHILTIWAEDDQGGKSTEFTRKFRVVHNRPPVITGQNKDLGIIEEAPSETYSVTDPEADSFTVVEKINGTVIRSFPGVAGKEETATIPPDIWLTLQPDVTHTLAVTATDKQGMTYTRSYTFKRFENKIVIDGLAVPFTTDIAAKRILITPDWVIPFGTVVKVETCNNAFDEFPTWEDCTLVVKLGRGYVYTNDKKTADKWGIDIRFHIEKGEAIKPISFQGFGGAFD